jgi:hypothetical protein
MCTLKLIQFLEDGALRKRHVGKGEERGANK